MEGDYLDSWKSNFQSPNHKAKLPFPLTPCILEYDPCSQRMADTCSLSTSAGGEIFLQAHFSERSPQSALSLFLRDELKWPGSRYFEHSQWWLIMANTETRHESRIGLFIFSSGIFKDACKHVERRSHWIRIIFGHCMPMSTGRM